MRVLKDEDSDHCVLEVEAEGDLMMEMLSVQNKSDLFRDIYGKPVVVRPV